MNYFSRLIAFRYLWSKKRESFITIISVSAILGVAIGVMVLTMTMAIMTGFEDALREKIVGSTHLLVFKSGGEIPNADEVESVIAGTSGVAGVSPFVQQQVLLRVGNQARGVLVKGINVNSQSASELKGYTFDPSMVDRMEGTIEVSETQADGSKNTVMLPPVIVGQQMVNSLGILPGMTLSFFTPQVSSTPFGLVPRYKRFVVSGTYHSGLTSYEASIIYVGIGHAQKFFRMGRSVSGFEVMLSDVDSAQRIAEEVKGKLSDLNQQGFFVQDWTEINKELWEAIKLEKQVYFIVLLLLIVLASFSIVSTLVMIVLEKRRDIAVMLTVGATSAQIGHIFRWQGIIIGLLGTTFGLVLGFAGCVILQNYGFPLPEGVFPTTTVPVTIDLANFIWVGVAAFVICCASTWYPVRRACSIDPSEILRME